MFNEDFINCAECIFFEECHEKESRDGCYFGEREEESND